MHLRAMAGVAALRGLTMVVLFLGGLGLDRGTTASAAEGPAELWTRERMDAAVQALDRMKADGFEPMSADKSAGLTHYQRVRRALADAIVELQQGGSTP